MYYAKPKNGQFYLSYQNLFKILKNCGIIDERIVKTKEIEIILQRINKGIKNYTSENFLDLLTKICMCINKNFYDDKKGTFINFIRTYLEPYCFEMDKISEIEITEQSKNNDLLQKVKIINLENDSRIKLNIPLNFKKFIENYSFDQLSFLILSSILEGLKQIYKYYFIYEINNYIDLKKIEKNSFKNYLTFCREFQIFPYLINKNLLELYWSIIISNSLEDLINNPNISLDKFNQNSYNIGTIYTFPKFVLLFSHIASFYFYTIEISKSEKLLYLIEKIYHSKGYVNFNKNICSTYNKKFCIVPPKDVIELINKKLLEDDKINNKKFNLNIGNFVNIQSFLGLNNENYMKLKKYIDKLKYLFNIYSQLVDKFQFGKLSFSNYQKLLYDGGLLRIKKSTHLKNPTILTQRHNNFISYSLIKSKNNLLENYKLNKSNSQPNILKNNSLLNISQGSYLDFPYNDTKKDKLNLADVNIICSTISGFINYNLDNNDNRKNNNWISNFNLNNSSTINSSTSRNNNILKFNFYLFLKSLPLISLRLYPNEKNDINESMSQFLDEKMNNFIEKLSGVLNIYSLVPEVIKLINIFSTNEKIQELIKDITPLIKNHFLNYADKKTNLINFDNFFLFFKDFDIYPHWLSLSNLREIFFAGCSKGKNKEDELMDYEIFIQCFVSNWYIYKFRR